MSTASTATTSKGNKGQQSRARLLTAAASEFAKLGYHETKVSNIVARAGLTQAAFYLYFSSKEAIFAELVADLRSRLRLLADAARLTPGLAPSDVPGRIRAGLELAFRFLQDNPDLTRLGLFVAPEAEEIKAEIMALLTANLRFEQAAGYLRPGMPVEIAAECLVGIVMRLAESQLYPGKQGPAALAEQAADIVLHGMLAESLSQASRTWEGEV